MLYRVISTALPTFLWPDDDVNDGHDGGAYAKAAAAAAATTTAAALFMQAIYFAIVYAKSRKKEGRQAVQGKQLLVH